MASLDRFAVAGGEHLWIRRQNQNIIDPGTGPRAPLALAAQERPIWRFLAVAGVPHGGSGRHFRSGRQHFAKSLIFHEFRQLPRISVDNIVGKSWNAGPAPREKGAGSGLPIK